MNNKKYYWHIFILCSFAFLQPLLDILSKNPQFFVIRRSQPIDIILFVIGLLTIPGFIFSFILISATFISKSFAKQIYKLALIFLFACILLPITKQYIELGLLNISIALGASCLLALLYFRIEILRNFIGLLFPALIISPIIFFSDQKIYEILIPKDFASIHQFQAKKPTNIIMLVFDELPLPPMMNENKEIDVNRFPGFAKLASNSYWFRNASSSTSWTEFAVPSILSGKIAENTKVMPSSHEYPYNLFTLLSSTHQLNVYEQVTHLCPDTLCKTYSDKESFMSRMRSLILDSSLVYLHILLPDDYKSGLPSISSGWNNFLNEENQKQNKPAKSKKGLLDRGDWADDVWLFNKFKQSLSKTEHPSLNFLHITFPHVPYRYYPSGKKYLKNLDRKNDAGYRKIWGELEWPTIQAMQRFYLQLSYLDHLIDQLIIRLKELNIYDSSLIVLTADHGTSFMPLQFSRRVSEKNYVDVMSVPLLFKLPGQKEGVIKDNNVSMVDVLPTIADIIDLNLPEGLAGKSALKNDPDERQDKTFHTLDEGVNQKLTFPGKFKFDGPLERQKAIFGSNFNSGWQYYAGFQKQIMKSEAADVTGLSPIKVKVENIDYYKDIDLNADFLPGYVTGQLIDVANKSLKKLLVSVNGLIQSGTETFVDDDGKVRFIAILPEDAFVQGKNEIEVYEYKGQ